jgi:hypothetical protein
MKKVVVALAAVVAVSGAVLAPPAEACGPIVRREVDPRAMGLAKAERALEQGQFAAAALNVTQAFPGIRSAQPGTDPLTSRALRVMALAVVRADGAITLGTDWRGATGAQRTQNIDWSAHTLRTIVAARPADPSAQGDLGEALAKIPKSHAEALSILNGLAQKDLLGSAHAYAALARLRAAAGDKPGRDAAVAKCQAMTQTQSICAAPNS